MAHDSDSPSGDGSPARTDGGTAGGGASGSGNGPDSRRLEWLSRIVGADSTSTDTDPAIGTADSTSLDAVDQIDGAGSTVDEGSGTGTPSRRNVLKAAGVAGAGALSLGFGGSASAAVATEECDGGTLDATENAIILDNQWSNPDAQQCIWVNDDGSYGWDFDATGTGTGNSINYPQALVGTKPWGKDSGTADFPIQRSDVDELVIGVETDMSISGGRWDFAEEWWLMEQPPSQQTGSPSYEIMLLIDWGGGFGGGAPQQPDLWTDQFGNTVDLYNVYRGGGGTDAVFFQFSISGGNFGGGKIDLRPIIDWLTVNEGVREDLWLTGIELGNEYWGGAVGETTMQTFDVTINGTTYETGAAGGSDPVDPGRVDLPATIQAEDYTNAYDTTSGNEGGAHSDGDVDVEATSDPQGGEYNVGWIASGEWLEYEVSVPSDTTLDVAARVASNDGGGSFHLDVDGSQAASASFAGTGGWQSWTTIDVGQVTLSGGTHTLRLTADSSGWNLNFLTFTTGDGGNDGGDGNDGGSADPMAELSPDSTNVTVGETITFQVEDTSDSSRWPVGLDWTFGDGTTASGWWNQHSYDSPGTYTVALTATANDGSQTTHEVTITVS